MMRVVVFLALVGVFALGAAWLADRPGDVAVTWQGWRLETSVMVAAAALLLVTAALMAGWSLLRAVVRSPDRIAASRRNRRAARGRQAISKGLIAIGAGDAGAARRFAAEAERYAPGEPLVLLLGAQTAQLSGDRTAAERTFRAMAGRADTKLLGLRGLYVEAQRRGDAAAARLYAEEAAKTAPAGWAAQAVLEFRSAAGDWSGALAALDGQLQSGQLDRVGYRRLRAVLLTARVLAAENSDRDQARALALEAVKLAPHLVPAAALAGRLLAEAGELRKASRVVETAWRANPHPDLAEAYAHLRYGDATRERLARVELLAQMAPGHAESALAVARAALDAQEFVLARRTLEPLLAVPTQRVALLMAELEEREHGDEGRAREWTARALRAARDPAWTADGFVSDRWLPASPVTGRLDALEWKVPLAELAAPGPVIEQTRTSPPLVAAGESVEKLVPPAVPAEPSRPAAPGRRIAEPVIPLVHAPDDPGPAPLSDAEPAPDLQAEGWRGWRQIFR
jgi:HemY protein